MCSQVAPWIKSWHGFEVGGRHSRWHPLCEFFLCCVRWLASKPYCMKSSWLWAGHAWTSSHSLLKGSGFVSATMRLGREEQSILEPRFTFVNRKFNIASTYHFKWSRATSMYLSLSWTVTTWLTLKCLPFGRVQVSLQEFCIYFMYSLPRPSYTPVFYFHFPTNLCNIRTLQRPT